MSARAALQALLEGDEGLSDLGVEAVYPTNAVDTPKEDCFLVITWAPSVVAAKTRSIDRFTVWVHDTDRDYGRITNVLARLRALIPEQVHLRGEDDWVLTAADWLGEGPDLFDAGYGTCTRYADFQGVSRYDSLDA